ncbi:MAG: hypothetical protein OHK0013_20970 [Sandaracinaceae bacterium]
MSNEDEEKRSPEREDADQPSAEPEAVEPSSEPAQASEASEPRAAEQGTGAGADAAVARRLSAGARLAAQKAAKAAVKAAKKQERRAAQQQDQSAADPEPAVTEAAPEDPLAQLNETELGRAALKAGNWWERNARTGWIALGAVALALVGFLGFTYHRDQQSAAAGALLREAVETASARIEAPAEGEERAASEDTDEERTFPTIQARDEAALEAYQRVISQFPDHPSAGIARLGAARALLSLGRHDEAREAFQQAFDRNGRSGVIAWQALEGMGFAQEAAGDLEGAQATYERLGNLEGHAYQSVATYHLARLQIRRGQQDEARTALRELVDSLRADTAAESSEPRFPYVLAQAELRLRELDPSSATYGGSQPLGAGSREPGGGDIDPAQLQELIRQLQAREGGSEGGEGGGSE